MPGPPPRAHVRAFVAASVPAELLDQVQRLQERLQGKLGARENPVRWTAASQIHLTLKFFGNVALDDLPGLISALGTAALGARPMQLCLRGLGSFPSWQRPSVIWIGVQGEIASLAALHSKIETATESFGSNSEMRAFHPHLTLGRVRAQSSGGRRIGGAVQGEAAVELGCWQVDEIALIQSQLAPSGSIYTTLANFKLHSP